MRVCDTLCVKTEWSFDVLLGRILSNFKQVKLSEGDYEMISAIGHGNARRCALWTRLCLCLILTVVHRRYNTPMTYKPKWNINIFGEKEEKLAANTVKIA